MKYNCLIFILSKIQINNNNQSNESCCKNVSAEKKIVKKTKNST